MSVRKHRSMAHGAQRGSVTQYRRGILVLERLWRRHDHVPEVVPSVVSPTSVPTSCPEVVPPTGAFGSCPQVVPRTRVPNQRRTRKRISVSPLYPAPEPAARVQARALLALVQAECPEVKWVLQGDLERMHREICRKESRKSCHWNAIGRELAKLTMRRQVKRLGRRLRAYKIPRQRL